MMPFLRKESFKIKIGSFEFEGSYLVLFIILFSIAVLIICTFCFCCDKKNRCCFCCDHKPKENENQDNRSQHEKEEDFDFLRCEDEMMVMMENNQSS